MSSRTQLADRVQPGPSIEFTGNREVAHVYRALVDCIEYGEVAVADLSEGANLRMTGSGHHA